MSEVPPLEGNLYVKAGATSKLVKKAHRWHERYFVLSPSDEVLYFYDDHAHAETLIFKDQLMFDKFVDVKLYPASKQEGTRFDLIYKGVGCCQKTFPQHKTFPHSSVD
jgi:hypothetical protein